MARPIAPRFEIRVLKDKSVSDNAQIPAPDAVINFYRAGATVSDAVTIPPFAVSVPVNIFDPGALVLNDRVHSDTGTGILIVSGITYPDQLLITSNIGSAITLPLGSRLVPIDNRPNAFMDPLGTFPIGTSLPVDAAGRASAYLMNDRVDHDVTIPGQQTRLFVDAAGTLGRSDEAWNDIRDFGLSVQAAIDALPADGGTVFVPTGTWTLTSGVTVAKPNVTIMGEQLGSTLRPSTPNSFDLITVNQTNFQMRDIILDGGTLGPYANGKSCLVVRGAGVSQHDVRGVALWKVRLNNAPRYGLWLRDVEDFYARSCFMTGNGIAGVRVERISAATTLARFVGGEIGQNLGRGLQAVGVTAVLAAGCTFEGNRVVGGEDDGAGVDVESCTRVELRSCYFEDANNNTTTPTKQFVAIRSCPSAVVTECWFKDDLNPDNANSVARRGVKFIGSPRSRLSNCVGRGMHDYLAVFDSSSLDCVEMGCFEHGLDAPLAFPRFLIDAGSIISMSRRAVSIPRQADENSFPAPTSVLPGAMVWVNSPAVGHSKLQVWDGGSWRNTTLTPP
jgi:hypothetical protein